MKPPARQFLLEAFMPYELSVAANRISRLFARRYSAEFGLSIAEWRVMAVLGRFGTLSPGAIADRTAMDKVKVSRAAARMVAAGLVAQTQADHDARFRRLRLTRRGAAMHAAIIPLAEQLEAQLAAAMPPDAWQNLRLALRALTAHAGMLETADTPEP